MTRLRFLLIALFTAGLSSQPLLTYAAAKSPAHMQIKKRVITKKSGNTRTHSVKKTDAEIPHSNCRAQSVKRGKRRKATRVCAASEPVLKSPIREVDLDKSAAESKDVDVKARTVPERAYAVDGETFFYQGRKIRASGISGGDGSEMAKQRLQKALDSGGLVVEPLSLDDAGVATANVRVNGKSLSDQMSRP